MASESEKKLKVLSWAVGLLVVLMVLQTGFIISNHFALKSKKDEMALKAKRRTSDYQGIPQKNLRKPKATAPFYQAQADSSGDPFRDPFFADPYTSMNRMRERMNRLMNAALTYGPANTTSFYPSDSFDFAPAIDLEETPQSYVVRADIPGLEKDKINVTVKNNMLTIQGIRETGSVTEDDRSGYYAQERSYGSFARTISLPGPVDDGAIQAEYRDGVLVITLPKSGDEKETQKIAVQ